MNKLNNHHIFNRLLLLAALVLPFSATGKNGAGGGNSGTVTDPSLNTMVQYDTWGGTTTTDTTTSSSSTSTSTDTAPLVDYSTEAALKSTTTYIYPIVTNNDGRTVDYKPIILALQKLDTFSPQQIGRSPVSMLLGKILEEAIRTNEFFKAMDESLVAIKGDVKAHYELDKADYRRKEVAAALVKYWGDLADKDYQFKKELLFMPAPGVDWAIALGKDLGGAKAETYADELIAARFKKYISGIFPVPQEEGQTETATTEEKTGGFGLELYNDIMEKLKENDNDATALNLANVLRSKKVDKATAEQFMKMMSDPYPDVDNAILKKLKESPEQLTVTDKQKIVDKLIQGINVAPSTNAIGDILGRRMVDEPKEGEEGATTETTTGTTGTFGGETSTTTGSTTEATTEKQKSLIEIMDDYSMKRIFNDPEKYKEWYAKISTSSDTALLRELVYLIAFNTWVRQQEFKMQEQQLAIAAMMNINMNRMYNMIERLTLISEAQNPEAARKALDLETKLRNLRLETDIRPTGP